MFHIVHKSDDYEISQNTRIIQLSFQILCRVIIHSRLLAIDRDIRLGISKISHFPQYY